MRKYSIHSLPVTNGGHIFSALVPGQHIHQGGLSILKPLECPHPDYHAHKDQEVFVALQGRALLTVNGESQQMEAGDVVVIDPGEDHQLVADRHDPLVVMWFHAK